jgi:hypothetical protein
MLAHAQIGAKEKSEVDWVIARTCFKSFTPGFFSFLNVEIEKSDLRESKNSFRFPPRSG